MPRGQPRQRTRVFKTKAGDHVAGNYTPENAPVNLWKAAILLAYQEATDAPPAEGNVLVHIAAVFPRPKGKIWKTKPMPRELKATKPDADNMAKAILDSLNKTAWRDDSQVHLGGVYRYIASGAEQPHTVVTIDPAFGELPVVSKIESRGK